MNAKRLLLMLILVLATTLMLYSVTYAVSLSEGYDDEILTQEGTTSWEDDLEALEEREIERILMRIRAGDTNVLNYVVYQVYERLHFTILAISSAADPNSTTRAALVARLNARYPDENAEEFINRARVRYANLVGQSYYRIVGYRNSIPAFIAGFNNQDPKVRLKCIGYLGDWVDEVGLDLITIETAAALRIGSGLETREEVRFALEILRLKILRKRILKQIYIGNLNVLDEIPATDFVVLVKDEDFIRNVYNIPSTVVIGSIRLDPYMIRTDSKVEAIANGTVSDNLWRLDTFDFSYNNANAFKAIFEGLNNPSLFVRENCVRILLEMVYIATGTPQDPNQATGAIIANPNIDVNGEVTNGILSTIKTQAYYITLAQKTWDYVQFATFANPEADIRYTGLAAGNNNDYYAGLRALNVPNAANYAWATTARTPDPAAEVTVSSANPRTNEGDGTEITLAEQGHYNYRIMVADLLRLMGLKWYLGEAEQPQTIITNIPDWSVYTLFDSQATANAAGNIDRHDILSGERQQP